MTGCVDQCENVKLPYPFGVGSGCYHDESYEIICSYPVSPSKPFLRQFDLEVLDINWPGRYIRQDNRSFASQDTGQILIVNIPSRNLCASVVAKPMVSDIDFQGSLYQYSRWYNVLMVEGCGGRVVLMNETGAILGGCASVCSNGAANMNRSNCYGINPLRRK